MTGAPDCSEEGWTYTLGLSPQELWTETAVAENKLSIWQMLLTLQYGFLWEVPIPHTTPEKLREGPRCQQKPFISCLNSFKSQLFFLPPTMTSSNHTAIWPTPLVFKLTWSWGYYLLKHIIADSLYLMRKPLPWESTKSEAIKGHFQYTDVTISPRYRAISFSISSAE